MRVSACHLPEQKTRLEKIALDAAITGLFDDASDYRVGENCSHVYDQTSVSPDFANGAVTGAFAYLATSVAEENSARSSLAAKGDVTLGSTYIDTHGELQTDYTEGFFEKDSITQQSVLVHEGVHRMQFEQYATHNYWGFVKFNLALYWNGPSYYELPAYRVQADFIANYPTQNVSPAVVSSSERYLFGSVETMINRCSTVRNCNN